MDARVVETSRLVMRPFVEDDVDAYAALMSDSEITRYLPDARPRDRGAAWREIALCLGHLSLRGFSQCAVVEKTTGALIGRAGLWHPEGWPGLEVGWIFGRSAWGRGYATEAGAAWRDYAFDVLGAGELCSVIHPDNVGSIRVAERIGHTYQRDTQVGGQRVLIYAQQRPASAAVAGA